MNYTLFDITNVKYKKIIKYTNGYYINFTNAIIIQPPQMKIGMSCKKSEHGNNYLYTVIISEELETFKAFIELLEDNIIHHIKTIKKSLLIDELTFNSALYSPEDSELDYFKIKLIVNKTGQILTLINNNLREMVSFDQIKSDNHLDQYIELSGISITNAGQIYPIWTAHQIVITPILKLYTKKLLLDELYPKSIERSFHPREVTLDPIIKSHGTGISKPTVSTEAVKNVLKLNPSMLMNMKANLKTI